MQRFISFAAAGMLVVGAAMLLAGGVDEQRYAILSGALFITASVVLFRCKLG